MRRKKHYNKHSITFELCDKANEFFNTYTNNVTQKAFRGNYKKYITFCREKFDCKTEDDCKKHIQDYADYLTAKGCTASTVHTYISPCCLYLGVDMKTIEKPLRKASEFTRGRYCEARSTRKNAMISNPKYKRTVEFQKRVGIRRTELANLCGDDLVRDESGYLCVRVKRGKGGKMQLQRILPGDEKFTEKYFKGKTANDRIFSEHELNNDVPYHYLRAKLAQRAYAYYADLLSGVGGEEMRELLINEMRMRFEATCGDKLTHTPRKNRTDSKETEPTGKKRSKKKFNEREARGTYTLRGDNRKFALEHGLPVSYDKTCLLAVSMFHLSHYRNNVTVVDYLLVV